MRRAFALMLLGLAATASAQAQSTNTLYLLCRAEPDVESLLKIAPGEFRMYDGAAWSENICAAAGTSCSVTGAGVFSAVTVSGDITERMSIDTMGGALRWTNGFESQTGQCGQVEEPRGAP